LPTPNQSVIEDLVFRVCAEVSGCKYLYDSLLTGAILGAIHKRGLTPESYLVVKVKARVIEVLPRMGFRTQLVTRSAT